MEITDQLIHADSSEFYSQIQTQIQKLPVILSLFSAAVLHNYNVTMIVSTSADSLIFKANGCVLICQKVGPSHVSLCVCVCICIYVLKTYLLLKFIRLDRLSLRLSYKLSYKLLCVCQCVHVYTFVRVCVCVSKGHVSALSEQRNAAQLPDSAAVTSLGPAEILGTTHTCCYGNQIQDP